MWSNFKHVVGVTSGPNSKGLSLAFAVFLSLQKLTFLNSSQRQVCQLVVRPLCSTILSCRLFNCTYMTLSRSQDEELTILVCSNNNMITGWSISFHSRCKHSDIVVDILL